MQRCSIWCPWTELGERLCYTPTRESWRSSRPIESYRRALDRCRKGHPENCSVGWPSWSCARETRGRYYCRWSSLKLPSLTIGQPGIIPFLNCLTHFSYACHPKRRTGRFQTRSADLLLCREYSLPRIALLQEAQKWLRLGLYFNRCRDLVKSLWAVMYVLN